MQLNCRWMILATLIALSTISKSEIYAQQQDTTKSIPIVRKTLGLMIDNTQKLQDTTLQGDVEYIVGSTDEKGSVTLKATTDGSSYTEIRLPSQTIRESVVHSGSTVSGQRSNGSSAVHGIALHNLMTDSAWFCPAMLVQHFVPFAESGEVTASTKTHQDGTSVEQLVSYRHVSKDNSPTSIAFQRLTATNLFLDSISSMPILFTYNTHQDNNSLTNIPVEVHYEDYKSFEGIMVATHIKKFVNGVLMLDIHITSANVNSNLVASQFSLQ